MLQASSLARSSARALALAAALGLSAQAQTALIAGAISPSSSALSGACLRADRDSRSGVDGSAIGVIRVRTGSSPVAWHGAVPGLYRYCRALALQLAPLPTGKALSQATTQQLTLGATLGDPKTTEEWKVAFALGSRRLGPTVQDMSGWKQLGDGSGRWQGFNVYHFDPIPLSEMLRESRKTGVPLYLLIVQSGKVQRWTVK